MKLIAMNNLVPAAPAPARRAFSLVELLIVISIIGILSAFLMGVMGGVTRTKTISNARAEMSAIETALERYKAVYGVYPPGNPTNFLVNPLYFELSGTTNNGLTFSTLDGMNSVLTNNILASFGVGGFINCSRGSGEDMVPAKVFLPGLKANQIGTVTNPVGTPAVAILVSSVRGPDLNYLPLGAPDLNPWRYNSGPTLTNNPGTYELYIQLKIGGKTNLICNWTKQTIVNSPLP